MINIENFKNSNELLKELLKDKKFSVIDNRLNVVIKSGIKNNPIDCIFAKDKITIIFNDNDKI